MNKLNFVLAFLFLLIFCSAFKTEAQFSISFHVGHPPAWAPPQYASRVRYYYFPEYDLYYDAQRQGYYYEDGNSWMFSTGLPFGYHESHLASTEKVALDYFGEHPYNHFSQHRLIYVRRFHPHWSQYGWRRPPGYHHGYPGRPGRPGIPSRPIPPRPNPPRPISPPRPHPGFGSGNRPGPGAGNGGGNRPGPGSGNRPGSVTGNGGGRPRPRN